MKQNKVPNGTLFYDVDKASHYISCDGMWFIVTSDGTFADYIDNYINGIANNYQRGAM